MWSSASAKSALNTTGTMFNTQIYFGPNGAIIQKHQKIMPTVGERLVHMGGYGDTFGAFPSEFGPMSGLICGENSNPLAVFALIAEGTRVHAASWPNHFRPAAIRSATAAAIDLQAFAQMSKAFVISACGTVDDHMIEMLKAGPEGEKFLRDPNCCGGSLIVDPMARIIAGPMGPEEGILYAECNLDLAIQMKLRHDFAGHYNRPDIFQMHINRAAPQLLPRAQRSGGASGSHNRRTARTAAAARTTCRRMNFISRKVDQHGRL